MRERKLDNLRLFSMDAEWLHRVHSTATVTAAFHGGWIYVADDSSAAAVRTDRATRFAVGTRLSIAGFLAPGRRFLLTESLVRERGRGEVPPPARIELVEALSGARDTSLVRMEGRLPCSTATRRR